MSRGPCIGGRWAGFVWMPVLLALGCSRPASKPDPARLAKVEGVVTAGGVPAAKVAVVFVPLDSQKPTARGMTDARGRYVVQYKGGSSGIEPGEYKVLFLFVGPPPPGFTSGAPQPDFSDPAKTPYRATVGASGAMLSFDLKKPPSSTP